MDLTSGNSDQFEKSPWHKPEKLQSPFWEALASSKSMVRQWTLCYNSTAPTFSYMVQLLSTIQI